MSATGIVLIGSGPLLDIAHAIATATHEPVAVRVVELPPDAIASADVVGLVGRPATLIETFAAVGLHALNHARSDLVVKLTAAGYARGRLIDPRAHVDPSAKLGTNVIVAASASIGPRCVIDDGAVILGGAMIEAGARVGAYAWIGANVAVGFGAAVGAHAILRPGVNLDAGVPVGDHCELATPGLRQKAIPDRTFETAGFDRPVRVYGGRATMSSRDADGG